MACTSTSTATTPPASPEGAKEAANEAAPVAVESPATAAGTASGPVSRVRHGKARWVPATCPGCGAPVLEQEQIDGLADKVGTLKSKLKPGEEPDLRCEEANKPTKNFLLKHMVEAGMPTRLPSFYHGYHESTISRAMKKHKLKKAGAEEAASSGLAVGQQATSQAGAKQAKRSSKGKKQASAKPRPGSKAGAKQAKRSSNGGTKQGKRNQASTKQAPAKLGRATQSGSKRARPSDAGAEKVAQKRTRK
ncbi:hypothetical protein ABPG75_007883 [Micractinium tetrahymenae]